jgi:hypothetical protein
MRLLRRSTCSGSDFRHRFVAVFCNRLEKVAEPILVLAGECATPTRGEPAGLFAEQCSSADLDGTNPPAVPRQHALPHDLAAGVAGVVAVIVVVRIVVAIGVRPVADPD